MESELLYTNYQYYVLGIFSKGYVDNWSRKIAVDSMMKASSSTYEIEDSNGVIL